MNIIDFITGEKIKTWGWRMRLARILSLPILAPVFVIGCIIVVIILAPIVAGIKIYEHVKYGKDLGI